LQCGAVVVVVAVHLQDCTEELGFAALQQACESLRAELEGRVSQSDIRKQSVFNVCDAAVCDYVTLFVTLLISAC
jgi:hypothetical protein